MDIRKWDVTRPSKVGDTKRSNTRFSTLAIEESNPVRSSPMGNDRADLELTL